MTGRRDGWDGDERDGDPVIGGTLLKFLGLAVALYAALIGIAYSAQHWLTYLPDPVRVPPSAAGLVDVRETVLRTADGEQVIVWRADARAGQPTLIYFHGNGSALANRAPRIAQFQAEGWGVAMMAYRGYGGSTGVPSERANMADAVALFDALVGEGLGRRDIFLYGESLGTGVATRVAVERPGVGGVILESPYTTLGDAGAAQFWFLPVRWLLKENYATITAIHLIGAPLLVLHGALDRTIPIALGERVFTAAQEPKRMVRYPAGGHNDLYLAPSTALSAVRAFVQRVRSGQPL